MPERILYLAWQDKALSRRWFPVARLDADTDESFYRFRYINGVRHAISAGGFSPLFEFPKLDGDYKSAELFPLFSNRVLSRKRPDRSEYLQNLDLPEDSDPIEVLSVSGGRRETDFFEVFPRIHKRSDGSFTTRFLLHGWRHASKQAQERIDTLEAGDKLHIALELTNPDTSLAVQVQTVDYVMVGWAPRYLVRDLVHSIIEKPGAVDAKVVRVNPIPSPSRQRLLIEMNGSWQGHEPMSHDDFTPYQATN